MIIKHFSPGEFQCQCGCGMGVKSALIEMLNEDVRDLKTDYVTQNEWHRLEYEQTRADFESMRQDIQAEFRQLRLIMSDKADKP